jgi:hypothetical protein
MPDLTTVGRMQDRAVVAAVVAGDAEGVGAAYDTYAASLYARCRSVLPADDAAEAVFDTFLVAAARLDRLRDPDRLGPWLIAVARNECRRRMDPGRAAEAAGAADPGGEPPAEPPPGLRGRVVAACTDNSPAGRAHRVSAAHRAGAFGPAGFPKPPGRSGPRWWRDVRRRRAVTAAVAAGVALALTAGITVMLTAGGAGSRPQAAGPGLAAAGRGPALSPASSAASSAASSPVSSAASSPDPGRTSPAPSSARTVPGSAQPAPPAAVPVAVTSPATPGPPATSPAPSPSQTPSPSPSPWPSTTQGILVVKPDSLQLTSASGKPVSGSFTITAVGGPVRPFTVRVAAAVAARVKVAPASGSLTSGQSVRVTVTVTSKTGLTTHVIVQPGNLAVTVVYKVKA